MVPPPVPFVFPGLKRVIKSTQASTNQEVIRLITGKKIKTSSANQIYELCKTDDLFGLFDIVDNLADNSNYYEINKIIFTIDYQKLTPKIAIGLLRVAFPIKRKLPQWDEAVSKARDALARNNMNAARLLKGIL
ncbi:hypothetical protein [Microvirgula aerodenitrificans]|uniref:hypothetical protein n=1 Tax=Microvirgula aerodenitrificans TaxID=57480 RepID=UPI0012EC07A5|nr:hypothetical protein [Microvirgula aerodenitrificans]